jgi:hypothetical protein
VSRAGEGWGSSAAAAKRIQQAHTKTVGHPAGEGGRWCGLNMNALEVLRSSLQPLREPPSNRRSGALSVVDHTAMTDSLTDTDGLILRVL